MPLDPKRFPRLHAHLENLPAGLKSYPECQAKGTLVRSFVSEVDPAQVRAAGLPAEVEAVLLQPPSNSRWVPEVLSWSGIFVVGDLLGLDEASWLDWVRRKNRELYTNPVMRVVMNFTSPRLALSLASAYWGVLHQGSRLQVVDSQANTAQVALTYPERLFNQAAAKALAVAFEVALELSRARRPEVRVDDCQPAQAIFSARWS